MRLFHNYSLKYRANSGRIFAYRRTDNRFSIDTPSDLSNTPTPHLRKKTSIQSRFYAGYFALLDHTVFTPHGVNYSQLLRDKIA